MSHFMPSKTDKWIFSKRWHGTRKCVCVSVYFSYYLYWEDFLLELCAAAAKSLQSCLTLCDPIDGSPPGSPIPGILQARTLEWVAIVSKHTLSTHTHTHTHTYIYIYICIILDIFKFNSNYYFYWYTSLAGRIEGTFFRLASDSLCCVFIAFKCFFAFCHDRIFQAHVVYFLTWINHLFKNSWFLSVVSGQGSKDGHFLWGWPLILSFCFLTSVSLKNLINWVSSCIGEENFQGWLQAF